MDLELTDEQRWLSESVETLLVREWPGAGGEEDTAAPTPTRCGRRWSRCGLSVDRDEGLGAVELCLGSRALGAHLACAPYVGSAALRFAAEPSSAPQDYAQLVEGDDAVSIALLEPDGDGRSRACRRHSG